MNAATMRAAAGLCTLLLFVAGCGGSDESSSAPKGSGTKVTVTEKDFSLELSQNSFSPGTYTFVAKNAGAAPHALEVEGSGIEEQKTDTLTPGKSAELTVTLKKGTYELYCPVDGHKDKGMKTEITVS